MSKTVAALVLAVLFAPAAAAPAEDPAAVRFRYRQALPGYRFEFPRDHASHEAFRTEWWYYTGNVVAENGGRYGFQVTFFRIGLRDRVNPANPSRWRPDNVYFAHLALSDLDGRQFRYWHRTSRAGPGLAGAATDRYEVFIGDWRAWLETPGAPGSAPVHRLRLSVPSAQAGAPAEVTLDLALTSEKPPVVHGRDGVSQKAEGLGRASHYYSLTRLSVSGRLALDGRGTTVEGRAWMDHEFGSNQLGEGQVGWDWFSLQLADGSELMLYRLRLKDGRVEPASSGTLVRPDGTWRTLALADFRLTPLATWTSRASGGTYPVRWRVEVPSEGIDLTVEPALEDQELRTEGSTGVTYWEGSVAARGVKGGRPVEGRGYLEMTGYAKPFDTDIQY